LAPAARAAQLGISPEEAERQDFAPDSPRGNAICRMVDASEIAFVAVPGLGKGLGGLRRAGLGKRRGRAVGILLSSVSKCVSIDISTWKAVLRSA